MPTLYEAARRSRLTTPRLIGLRNRHFFLLDLVVFSLTPVVTMILLFDGVQQIGRYVAPVVIYSACALLVRSLSFYACDIYRRYWRSATAMDLVHIAFSGLLATFVVCVLTIVGNGSGILNPALPRFFPLLDGLLTFLLAGAARLSVRVVGRPYELGRAVDARPALIIGAGLVGERIVRELRASPALGLWPVGFLDDDPSKHGLSIQGIPVLGSRHQLAMVVREYQIFQVIIALPSVSGTVIRETLDLCELAGVQAKTVPSLTEVLAGRVRVNELRNVDIEDVLRREPIDTNIDAVRDLIENQRVLITGAGGSIGSELARQVFALHPSQIGLLGHGENSIFEVFHELKNRSKSNGTAPPELRPIIADIRSEARMLRVMREFRPHIILHAAAHKHVPLMQENPTEAVSNNILGTKNLVEAALQGGVEHLVMISTDKVVNPSSIMGASKRVAEMAVLQAARQSGRHYVAVRFGNVLGSRGSVVPIFKKQIAAGGPVTVSHPDMTRYFITIPEAVQLVLQAAVLGQGQEIFMLDMGEPVAIVDLARDLIELSGLEVGKDIDIVFSGIRPGEKLTEELFVRGEVYEPTLHNKILIVKNAGNFVSRSLDDLLPEFAKSVDRDDPEIANRAFKALIPGFDSGAGRSTPTATQTFVSAIVSGIDSQDGARQQAVVN